MRLNVFHDSEKKIYDLQQLILKYHHSSLEAFPSLTDMIYLIPVTEIAATCMQSAGVK